MSLKRFALKAIIIMLVIVFGLTLMASLGLNLIDLSNNYNTHLSPNNCPEGQHVVLGYDEQGRVTTISCRKDES